MISIRRDVKKNLTDGGYGSFRLVWFWDFFGPGDKIRQLRRMITAGAADPRINDLASSIIAASDTAARDSVAEAQLLLSWVQQNIRYVSEKRETFRGAAYTAAKKYGDCDDMVVLLGAMLETVDIPTRIVTLGKKRTGQLRTEWFHVFIQAGLPARKPTAWVPAEITLPKPLGWDPITFAKSSAARAGIL